MSFALNDRPGVSEVTRDRVRRVAEQLGWRPSTAARALSGEGAATVGLVLARPAATLGVDSFFLQLISGIQEVLAERQLGPALPGGGGRRRPSARSTAAGGPSTGSTGSWWSTRAPTTRARTSWTNWVCPASSSAGCPDARAPDLSTGARRRHGGDGLGRRPAVRTGPPADRAHRGPAGARPHRPAHPLAARRGRPARADRGPLGDHGLLRRGGRGGHPPGAGGTHAADRADLRQRCDGRGRSGRHGGPRPLRSRRRVDRLLGGLRRCAAWSSPG